MNDMENMTVPSLTLDPFAEAEAALRLLPALLAPLAVQFQSYRMIQK